MTKKLTSIILTALLLWTLCPLSIAAEEYAYTAEFESEKDFLIKVNSIVPSDAEPGKTVTRGEFARYAVKMLNRSILSGTEAGVIFKDVRPDEEINGYLSVLAAEGIIEGDSGGYFRGGEEILYEEAAKMIVNVLGFNREADISGGYPIGYIAVAEKYKVFSGIMAKPGEALNNDMVCRLLYNTMNTPYAEINRIISTPFGTRAEYSAENNTILFSVYGIRKQTAVVTANGVTAIDGDTKAGVGRLKAGGVTYYSDISEYQELIGFNTEIYYTDSDGINEIVFAKKTRNYELTVNAVDIISAENGVLKYYDGTRKSEAGISADTDIIYNGKALKAYDGSKLAPKMGNVTFIDNDRDSNYEAVIVYDCKNLYVRSINASEGYIIGDYYGKTLCVNSVNNPKLEYCTIKTADGIESAVSQIKEHDIVTYAESEDESVLSLVVTSHKKSGTVLQFETGDEIRITVGETELVLDPYFKEYITKNNIQIKSGRSYDFYLDMFGNTAAINFDSTCFNWGYLIAAAPSPGIDKTMQMKIINSGGDIFYCDAEQSVTINGEKFTGADKISQRMSAVGNISRTALGYKLNAEGKISAMLLPLTYGESTAGYDEFLQPITNGAIKSRYKSGTRVVTPNIAIPDSAIVFDVPSDENDTSDASYATVLPALIPNDTIKEWQCYTNEDGSAFSDVVVVYDYSAATVIAADAYMMAVESVSKIVDKDGQEKYKVTGMYLRERVEYTAHTDDVVLKAPPYYKGGKTEYKVESGDIIRIALNSSNEITKIEMFYDYSDDDMCIIDTGYVSGDRWMLGTVYDKKDNYLIFAAPDENGEYKTSELQYFPKFVCGYTYDTVTKKVKSASYDDIKGSKDYGLEATKVFVQNHYGEMQTIIVYK